MVMLAKEASDPLYEPGKPAIQDVLLNTGETFQISNNGFVAKVIEGLQPAMLTAVTSGKAPALHIRNAMSQEWCDQVSERFAHHPATKKEGVTPSIYSLGTHLYSCPKGESASIYFRDIEQSNAAISDVLPNGKDPIVSFLQEACALNNAKFEYLSAHGNSVRHGSLRLWGKGSEAATGGRCYFAVPHEDYEETNDHHPLPQIYQSQNVFSIVLCIDAVHDREPETIVWNRRMTLEEIRDPNNSHPWASYGYRESLLEGHDCMLIRLKKGDAAIIPAHNVHAVIGYHGFQRCTYMGFFHIIEPTPDGFSKMIFRT
jgi:hypothetical protein